MNDLTDQQLLHEFAETHVEVPFEELIRRHVDLVYSAAKRLLIDPHLAEDVSQAVFAALAQNPAEVGRKLGKGAPLSGWLHVTTRNIAAKTVRAEMRRRARDEKARAMQEVSQGQEISNWDQIAPQLDHALAELSVTDRDALLLRFFERKTAREIGQRLGLSEEAAQKRVKRALESLREIFAARGVALPSAVLGTALAASAVQAAPIAVVDGIAKSIFIASSVGSSPASVVPVFHKLVSSVVMTKTQTAILLAVIATLILPTGSQHLKLSQLRAEVTDSGGMSEPRLASRSTQTVSAYNLNGEAEEIAKLRKRANELRAGIAAKRSGTTSTLAIRDLQAGPLLISNGRKELLKNLVFAGNATSEAALQSLLALQRDGDIDHLAGLVILPPKELEEWNEAVASPQKRNEFTQALIEEMKGVVMSEAYDGHEVHEGKVWPKDPQAEAVVSIQGSTSLDERRIQFLIKIERGDQKTLNSFVFGLTSSGWKRIGN